MQRCSSWIPLASSLVLALGLAGCGAPKASAPAKLPAGALARVAPPAPPVPPGHLARTDVDRVLTQLGPAWLLRRVLREETFDKDNKFTGWRITGLPEEWSAVDLRPGDVVKRVNGKPLETPDEAWDAWKSVAKARELRVELARDGRTRELVMPIDGGPTTASAEALERDAPPRQAPQGAPHRGVVQIGGDPPAFEGSDDQAY